MPRTRLRPERLEDRAAPAVFGSPSSLTPPGSASSAAVGDFNGDGRLDFAAGTPGSVAVYLGNGNGSFSGPTSFGVGGTGPCAVAVADVTGDGNLDIVAATGGTAPANGSVVVLAGDGAGGFAAGPAVDSGGRAPAGLVVADLDGQNGPDVAVANFGDPATDSPGSVGVLRNNGAGQFTLGTSLPIGAARNAVAVAAADFNGDGKLDLAAAAQNDPLNTNANGSILVFTGNGTGAFAAGPVSDTGGIEPTHLAAGDVTGDGRPDLAVAHPGEMSGPGRGRVTVLTGNPGGSFTPAVVLDGGDSPLAVAILDLDGDGKRDVAAVSFDDGKLSAFLGNGTGAFAPAIGSPFAAGVANPRFLALGAFDANLTPDAVVVGDAGAAFVPNGSVFVQPATLPGAVVGTAYSQTVTASGPVGGPSPTFAVTVGQLPIGLALNATTGLISGVPVTAGIFTFTITATSGADSGSRQFTVGAVAVGTVVLSPAALPDIHGRVHYGQTITASGPPGIYGFHVTAGSLPPGLTLDFFGNLSGTPKQTGTYHFTVTADNGLGNVGSQAYTITVTPATPAGSTQGVFAAAGAPNGTAALYAPAAGQYAPATAVTPFPGYTGPVRAATGDFNGDGFEDTVYVTGPGTPIRVTVIDNDTGTVMIAAFDPFGGDFTGGGFVTAGDFDTGGDEFAVTPDQGGGPRVAIFRHVPTPRAGGLVGTPLVVANFLGIDDANFRGGARAATGDVNGDGVPDLAVSAGFLGGPRVALFDGKTVLAGTPQRLIGDFFAFPGPDATTLRNGVFLTLGDVDGDSKADLILGGGPGGAPRVFILSGAKIAADDVAGAQANPIANFFVASDTNDRGGVRLAAKDADGDNRADVVAGSGEGRPSRVRVYLGKDFTTATEPATFQDIDPFGAVLPGGVFVG